MKKSSRAPLLLALGLATAAVGFAGTRPGGGHGERSASSSPASSRAATRTRWIPAQQPSSQNSLNVNARYDRLTTEDDNFKVLPSLATSWKANAKGTVWTFKLRKGVKFWDGHPFTSADVVYTFRRVIDPRPAPRARRRCRS